MARSKARFETSFPVGSHHVTTILTDEEVALINSKRAPSELLRPATTCGARKNTTTGEPCRDNAGARTSHVGFGYCATHGGNTPAGVRHAARIMGKNLIEERKNYMDRFGGDRNDPSIASITAEQALLEEVRRSVAMVRWLEQKIGEWDPILIDADQDFDATAAMSNSNRVRTAGNISVPQLVKNLPPLVDETSRGVASSTDQAEWLRVYREERTHAARVSKMCIDSGIAHRMVSIAEDQGRVLASSIKAVLAALSLDDRQQELVPRVVPAILRAVANNQPVPDISSLAPDAGA